MIIESFQAQFVKIKFYDFLGVYQHQLVTKQLPLYIDWQFVDPVMIAVGRFPDLSNYPSADAGAIFEYKKKQDFLNLHSTYSVLLQPWDLLIFRDTSGVIYEARNFYQVERTGLAIGEQYYFFVKNDQYYFSPFTLHLNEACSEFELLCDSEHYPGWVCKPIAPIARTVERMNDRGFK